jgi:Fe-S-cluster containining protein
MEPIEKNPVTISPEVGFHLQLMPEDRFVKALYASVDEVIARGLDHLLKEDGTLPTCRLGCCHCCSFPILISVAEARTLAQFVRRTFLPEKIESLRMRTWEWHRWDDSLRDGRPSFDIPGKAAVPPDDMPCPLLSKGECSAYEVRPLVCRTHFVFSHPSSCRLVNDPESAETRPRVINSIKKATEPYTKAMKDYIEKGGTDYSRSMTLLPHGLANEMGWNFDKEQ